jgi:hypothetical protein
MTQYDNDPDGSKAMAASFAQMDAEKAEAARKASYGPGKDSLSDPDDFTPEDPKDRPIKRPAPHEKGLVNPNGQGVTRTTSGVSINPAMPTFLTSYGSQIHDPAAIDGNSIVQIGDKQTTVAAALNIGLLVKTADGSYQYTADGSALSQRAAPQQATAGMDHSTAQFQNQLQLLESKAGFGNQVNGILGQAVNALVDEDNLAFGRAVQTLSEATGATSGSLEAWIREGSGEVYDACCVAAGEALNLDPLYIGEMIRGTGKRAQRSAMTMALAGDKRGFTALVRALNAGDLFI